MSLCIQETIKLSMKIIGDIVYDNSAYEIYGDIIEMDFFSSGIKLFEGI